MVDYVARALIDANPIGSVIFDGLLAIGTNQWDELRKQQRTRSDLDTTWAALNPLVLVLGTIILRSHVDRHLPEPLITPAQLRRWESPVNALMRLGQFYLSR